ncbi:hypothetical protein J6590_040851 [Homalodisca vitripennis]|nr:hypothetical protein J6590_040851 [Homalodisca vitripennis]
MEHEWRKGESNDLPMRPDRKKTTWQTETDRVDNDIGRMGITLQAAQGRMKWRGQKSTQVSEAKEVSHWVLIAALCIWQRRVDGAHEASKSGMKGDRHRNEQN